MRTIQFKVPDDIDLKDYDFSMIIASKLYEDGKLSSGQAAEIAGLSKRTFIELLGRYGVSVFSTSISDLHSDIANAQYSYFRHQYLKARKLAIKLNLKFTGTLGVFHKAKQSGFVDRIKPLIDKVLATNFRISEKIVDELLKINNE